jgi:hypothetical protein
MEGEKMTPEEFAKAMEEIDEEWDAEERHIKADELMARVLAELGYGKGAGIFEMMNKYYA